MRLRFWLNLSNSTRNRCTSARNSRCSSMAAIKTSALCFWCKLLLRQSCYVGVLCLSMASATVAGCYCCGAAAVGP